MLPVICIENLGFIYTSWILVKFLEQLGTIVPLSPFPLDHLVDAYQMVDGNYDE